MGRAASSRSEAAVSSRVGSEEYQGAAWGQGEAAQETGGNRCWGPEVGRSVDTQCREHVTLKNVPDTTSRLKGRARAKPCSSRLRNTNLYLHKHKQYVNNVTVVNA